MHIIEFPVFFLIEEKYIERYILSHNAIINDMKMNITWASVIETLIMVRFSPAKLRPDSRSMLNKNQGSLSHILIIH